MGLPILTLGCRTGAFIGLLLLSVDGLIGSRSALAIPPLSENNRSLFHVSATNSVQTLLRDARRELANGRVSSALELLEGYFERCDLSKVRPIARYYVFDAVGRIKLDLGKDTDGAIRFFTKLAADPRLSVGEQDIISGWIDGLSERKRLGQARKEADTADKLYEAGKAHYEIGLKKQKYMMDPASSADFSQAASHLVPLAARYDDDPRVGEVFFMLGDLHRRSSYGRHFWAQNYYLLEVIRRRPGTPLAMKAFAALEEDVHFGYSGSGGDHTPASWAELLKEFRAVARTGREPLIPAISPCEE